jgi:threonine aldolase
VILGTRPTFLFEAGGISALGTYISWSTQPAGWHVGPGGYQAAIRGDDPHFHHPPVTLENTHNRCGSVVLSVEYRAVTNWLQRRLAVHLDGARLFNAAIALGVEAKELTKPVDSVTFCLSKALCAPVGSVLCGSRAFITRAHRIRKQLGGGMRQAGVLAAAGIVALETMIERLAEDHERARKLADGLARIPGLVIDARPATNMVFISLAEDTAPLTASQVVERLAERGVKIGKAGHNTFRLVTHYWIDDEAVERAVAAFGEVL